jgi:hypothetical protein
LDGYSTVGLLGNFARFNNDLLVPYGGSGYFWNSLLSSPLRPINFSELRKGSELIEIAQCNEELCVVREG